MDGKCWGNLRSHPVIQADEGRSLDTEGEGNKHFRATERADLWAMGLWGLRVTAILFLKQKFGGCCCRLVVKGGVETRSQGISGMLTRNARWLAQ